MNSLTKPCTPADAFARFVEIVARLRDPNGGCPWDLEQTHLTLKPYLLEEAYEFLEAVDDGDDAEMRAELGDLLLQVVLHAQVAKDRQAFEVTDVINSIAEKMVTRHPHVFGDKKVSDTGEVLKNWEAIKKSEREQKATSSAHISVLEGVPKGMPALLRAQRLSEKAAKVGFDWARIDEVLEKVSEEIAEFRQALAQREPENIEHELGDILFAVTQLARWSKVSAENALQGANNRFVKRFHYVEEHGGDLRSAGMEKLEALWQEAKRQSKE